MIGSADDFGLAMVTLSLVFAAAALIRRWTRPLRALFIPTAVIGGFLALALGPQGIGRIGGGNGIFSPETLAVWTALPGLLINVMTASLLLGERIPPLNRIWAISGPHVGPGADYASNDPAVQACGWAVLCSPARLRLFAACFAEHGAVAGDFLDDLDD